MWLSVLMSNFKKSKVGAVASVPIRKQTSIKGCTPLISTIGGCIVHWAPSTEANLVPEIGSLRLCSALHLHGRAAFLPINTVRYRSRPEKCFEKISRIFYHSADSIANTSAENTGAWENILSKKKNYRIRVQIIIRTYTRHVETASPER